MCTKIRHAVCGPAMESELQFQFPKRMSQLTLRETIGTGRDGDASFFCCEHPADRIRL